MTATAQTNTEADKATVYQDGYSVYITRELTATKEFYVRWLDFKVVFESTWFIYLQSGGEKPVSLALIDEVHPSSPPSYPAFHGSGSFFTLQVEDAESVYQKLVAKGAPLTYHLKKEPWGQLRFGLTDPNGLYIDIVQQIEPEPGYWEKYMK